MLPNPKGGYHIVQKQRPMYKVRTPTWAPLIEKNEITYTKLLFSDLRMGYWKGMEVGRDHFSCLLITLHSRRAP
jgi:hypothetical protein